jgi:hypothetical protein
MRSNPPALAQGEFEDRKLVFQAALAQAEELWDAAAVGGPASRPLPLFYCLSQAGRAVCAAWTESLDWRPRFHGLGRQESDDPTPERRVFDYAAHATAQTRGAYSMLAAATRSPTFDGQTSVADFWASLPGFPTPRSIFGERPRCLMIETVQAPDDERPLFTRVAVPTHCILRFSAVDVAQLPMIYPTMAGIEQDGSRPSVFGLGEEPIYRFRREDGVLRPIHEVAERPFYAEDFLSSSLVVRPRVGTGAAGPPSDFLTLYALVWCLSELARYYPDTWVGALDPDRSPAAVILEEGLDLALEHTPRLISEALRGPMDELLRQDLERRRQEAEAVVGDEGASHESTPYADGDGEITADA